MDKIDLIKLEVQDWLNKQGHDKCWYYPDIFNKICDILEIQRPSSCLPTLEEFKVGCLKYQKQEYNLEE